jgi:hypothetical protein
MSENNPESNLMIKTKAWFSSRNTIKNLIGLSFGALGGYLYYHFVGCTSGGCAITSNPYMSVLWGGVMGYLLADIFKLKDKKSPSLNQDEEV